jgi:putative PIN family toxin of toxin-antitoxin system
LRVISGTDVLISSPYILGELERVLTYPRLRKRSGLTAADVAEYLESLARLAYLVTPESVPGQLLRDPTDEAILGTALAGTAEILCTRDKDLFEEKVQTFCRTRGIQVLADLEYLEKF